MSHTYCNISRERWNSSHPSWQNTHRQQNLNTEGHTQTPTQHFTFTHHIITFELEEPVRQQLLNCSSRIFTYSSDLLSNLNLAWLLTSNYKLWEAIFVRFSFSNDSSQMRCCFTHQCLKDKCWENGDPSEKITSVTANRDLSSILNDEKAASWLGRLWQPITSGQPECLSCGTSFW